ncbi:toll-like receptor 5 isoform X2 [Pseudophryne corroboree]|uniref:toll-like receptor 5 isoform X2 n=1 Tax=Pseudophryne corroboree TaxID=495146 RepID=UPI003081E247
MTQGQRQIMYYHLVLLFGGLGLAYSREFQCETVGRIAWFQFCNLTQIPLITNSTAKLILNFNYIHEVNSTSFPLLEKLVELQLSSQQTEKLTIQKNSFRNLPNLITLDLSYNIMLVLDQDAFVGLSRLENLILYYNSLNSSILENNYFRDLISLQYLDLSSNTITYLKPNPLFYYLHYFNLLSLKSNRITRICEGDLHSFQYKFFTVMDLSANWFSFLDTSPWGLCGNPFRNIYFDTLILSNNSFNDRSTIALCNVLNGTKLVQLKLNGHGMGPGFGFKNFKDPDNATFAGLVNSNLKILDISIGRIFSLKPYVFGKLSDLQMLILSDNKINQIEQDAFQGLHKLEYLYMISNLLGEIYNDAFAGLTNLAQIHLNNNHIGQIANDAFANLPNLQFVDLRGNAIKSIWFCDYMPFVIFIGLRENKLKSIDSEDLKSETVDLSENQLENLSHLSKLLRNPLVKNISLRKNRLSTCYDFEISRNNSLSYLDLSDNMIQLIWGQGYCLDMFQNLSSLQQLNLMNNYLRSIPDRLFTVLTSLQILNLSSNFFTHLTPGIFPNSLETLDVSKNQLLSPNPKVFLTLKALDITDNKFICECQLMDFLVWLNQTNTSLLGSPNDIYCVYPDQFLYKPLYVLEYVECDENVALRPLMFSLFVFTAVVIITFLTSVIVYNHFRGVFFGLYKRMIKSILEEGSQGESSYKYDAYLCYARKDFEWVERVFLRNLDSEYCDKNRFSLCFEERNFIPGEDHIINIRDAIWNSKKTICIVTKQFLQDGWCVEAFNYAQSRYFTELKDVLIMVVAGSLSQYQLKKYKPIRAYIQRSPYLKWPEDYQDVDWFLSRLSYKILKEEKLENRDVEVSTKGSALELHQIATIS